MGHPCEHVRDSSTPHGNKLRHALLHSRWLHMLLLFLLLVDASICMLSGVLESQFFEGKAKDLSEYMCAKNTNKNASGTPEFGCRPPAPHHRRLSGAPAPAAHGSAAHGAHAAHGTHHDSRSASKCYDDLSHDHSFGNHDLHTAEINMAKVSAGILVFFLLEQIILMIELKSEYFKPMFILDFFVICSSLAVEMLLITNAFGIGASAGLLIVARVWRFARVGHGMVASGEQVEDILEVDATIGSMEAVWEKLPEARWKEIKNSKKNMTAEQLEKEMSKDELKLVEELAKSPAVALRALAFARSFKKLHDKKVADKMHLGGLAMLNVDLEKFGVPEAKVGHESSSV